MSVGGLELVGVNLASGAFGPHGSHGVIDKDYTYAGNEYVDYYASFGLNVIRLGFTWERIQDGLFGELYELDLKKIQSTVEYAKSKGLAVILDMHNYGYAFGGLVGKSPTTNEAFADVWSKIADAFKQNDNVIFGLMNEPFQHSATEWLVSANSAIASIRDTGASQKILVPGSYWTGAHSWISSDNDTVVGEGVVDPLKNFAFEVHQYLDADSSGTTTQIQSTDIGVERLKGVTEWAEAEGVQLFLGEIGVGADPVSLTAFENTLEYMEQHNTAWLGVSYWAGGPWWGDYNFSIEPSNGVDKPQIGILEGFIRSTPPTSSSGMAIVLQPGIDHLTLPGSLINAIGNDLANLLIGNASNNVLSGLDGDDTIFGDAGNDTLEGGSGNDRLDGGVGANVMSGGAGDDTYEVNSLADIVVERAGEGVDTVTTWIDGYTLADNVENLVLTGTGWNSITGNGLANRLTGNDSANILNGRGGDDLLTGGGGNDTFVIARGEGSDTVTDFRAGVGAGDVLRLDGFSFADFAAVRAAATQSGADLVIRLASDQTLTLRGVQLSSLASDDVSLVNIKAAPAPVVTTPVVTAPTTPTNSGTPALGGATTNTIRGTSAKEALNGSSGNDLLLGSGGDTLSGGAGDDTYEVNSLADIVVERAGEGVDTVTTWIDGYTLPDNVENLVLTGTGWNSITGNGLANRLTGNDSA
ncbi:cellulase family glycosylhydrolase, partial [Roseomonas sp. GCM10028921]